MDQNKYAKLIQRLSEPAVPPGNPIADYFQNRADNKALGIAASGVGTSGLSGAALLSLIMGEPLDAALLGGGAYLAAGVTDDAIEERRRRQGASDMWFNRFGNNDGRQGLPGTPSGPTYRR